MAIKTCLFDMGNVLVHFSHDKMCRNVATVAGAPEAQVRDLLLHSGLQWKLERGDISEREFHDRCQQQLRVAVDFDSLKHAVADIFRLNHSIVPLLAELKQLGLRLVLLSNTSITHLEFIQEKFGVLKSFDAITTSYQARVLKPHARIYEDALSKADCEPQECFYTDDIEEYVVAARNFGIHAAVYYETTKTRGALQNLGIPVSS
ncbi:MAG: HAD family phosphatase [Fuerstiella sp.]|jgi:putative hydrolase of the HAD superfamily|nr:HAD family phosphatase [Fuerstiella sp.]